MTEMLLDRSNITLNYNLLEDDIRKFLNFVHSNFHSLSVMFILHGFKTSPKMLYRINFVVVQASNPKSIISIK